MTTIIMSTMLSKTSMSILEFITKFDTVEKYINWNRFGRNDIVYNKKKYKKKTVFLQII